MLVTSPHAAILCRLREAKDNLLLVADKLRINMDAAEYKYIVLGALPIIMPPPEHQASFAESVGPWVEFDSIVFKQFRTLNNLLPKLLSGESPFKTQPENL